MSDIKHISFTNGIITIIDAEGLTRPVYLADYLLAIIDTAQLTDEAVTQAKIGDDAVGGDQIEDNAVDSEHITPRSILARHLSDGFAFSLYQSWNEFGELKELRANESHGYANVEER